jgi:hypothetical protein
LGGVVVVFVVVGLGLGLWFGWGWLKIPSAKYWGKHPDIASNLLFDLQNDPAQERPIEDAAIERTMLQHLDNLMRECDAPDEQWQRLGLIA